MTPEFLIISLVVAVTPGIGVLYTLSAALMRGARAGVIAALGCTLGIVPHALAAILGLAALIYASSIAFQVLKYLGVAYLLYLAWITFRDRSALRVEADQNPRSARQVIWRAIAVNLLNPKLSLFFLAFLPQFVTPGETHATLHLVLLTAVFMAMTFAVFTVYGLLAAQVRRHVVSQPRIVTWLRRIFALTFVGLAARLVVAER